jgi:hypothetical protein
VIDVLGCGEGVRASRWAPRAVRSADNSGRNLVSTSAWNGNLKARTGGRPD